MTAGRYLCILIEPNGDEWFSAYGPHTKARSEATEYTNEQAAHRAGRSSIYGNPDAFWDSERRSAALTAKEHRGWTYRVEPA